MTDYAEYLTKMNKLEKQLYQEMLKSNIDAAHDLSITLLGEIRLLSMTLLHMKLEKNEDKMRETASRSICETSYEITANTDPVDHCDRVDVDSDSN